jgi:hypothetical protein
MGTTSGKRSASQGSKYNELFFRRHDENIITKIINRSVAMKGKKNSMTTQFSL